jgi:hypothetical protein
LRAKLLARATRHRGIRAACRAGEVLWDAVEEVDRDNQTFLSQHLVSGWLGADLVGRDGAHACWLLVQNAATAAQRKVWFPWMQRAVLHGCADERDLAFLDDRVAREAGRAQLHGTVTYGDTARLWPLAEPDTLPELRAMLHLPPLSDQDIAAAWTFAELASAAPGVVGQNPAHKPPAAWQRARSPGGEVSGAEPPDGGQPTEGRGPHAGE